MSRSAIILVNWNGWRDTVECLASLQRLAERPLVTIVVDNASTDGSAERIAAWCAGREVAVPQQRLPALPAFEVAAPPALRWAVLDEGDALPVGPPEVLLLKSRTNRGFAGGNNLGLELARAYDPEGFWLLNTDTVVDPGALQALERRARQVPAAGMVGSTLLYYGRPDEVQAAAGARFDRRTGSAAHVAANVRETALPEVATVEAACDYIVGASLYATRAFVDAVGGMCEDYFLYFEEIDWALRAQGRFGLAWARDSRVFHKVGGSSRRTASRTALRYLYRNRLRVMQRFFPAALGSTRRHLWLQVLQHARRGHWDAVREIAGALAHGPR